MNWENLLALGTTAGALLLAFLYARASVKAAGADNLRKATERLLEVSKAQREVVKEKEDYIRELEKTVLGNLPASELAARLNRLFQANRNRTSGTLPARKPGTGTTKH